MALLLLGGTERLPIKSVIARVPGQVALLRRRRVRL